MAQSSEQYYLYRAEIEPFARYRAPTQSFLVCAICSVCILPGEIIFDLNDSEVAHDECGMED